MEINIDSEQAQNTNFNQIRTLPQQRRDQHCPAPGRSSNSLQVANNIYQTETNNLRGTTAAVPWRLVTSSTHFLFLKIAFNVLFFRMKQRFTMPSHSLKLMGGGGLRCSKRTTRDSTLGGGRKLCLPTFITCCTFDSNCALTVNLEYRELPGGADKRCANSSWYMITADRKNGRCPNNLNVMPDEI